MTTPVPEISISLAPPEEILEEPYSPFSPTFFIMPDDDDDAFRPKHLSPPAAVTSPRFARQLSPLRPLDAPVMGAGLGRERFEAMLKASKERSAAAGAKKAANLRKEIALKAHKSKQRQLRDQIYKDNHPDPLVLQSNVVRSFFQKCKHLPPRLPLLFQRLLQSPLQSSTIRFLPPVLTLHWLCSTHYRTIIWPALVYTLSNLGWNKSTSDLLGMCSPSRSVNPPYTLCEQNSLSLANPCRHSIRSVLI